MKLSHAFGLIGLAVASMASADAQGNRTNYREVART
jgi:hypothetical protein